jgi:hypothetical protein
MAWIEDAEQRVLLVRQAVGLRLWTLPGGKVKRGESLVKALRRCRFQLNRTLSHFWVRFFQLNRGLNRLFSAKS